MDGFSSYHAHLRKAPRFGNWRAMIQCCADQTNKRYGARGIKVCPEWRDFPDGFLRFCEDLGPKPSPTHSIERRNADGPYSPENCCWADSHQQARNTSRSIRLEWEGNEWCLEDLATAHGLAWTTLYMRLEVYGWPLEKALTAPQVNGGNRTAHGTPRRKLRPHELLRERLAGAGITRATLHEFARGAEANPFVLEEYLATGKARGWEASLPGILACVEAALRGREAGHAAAAA